MNKKIIIVLAIVIIIIIVGIICHIFQVGGNKQIQNQPKNSADKDIPLKNDAEVNNKTCVTEPGKAYYPPKEKCCDGLTTIFGSELPNGECWCTEKNNTCGGAPICAPCGNKKCEKEYGEDKCNCMEDCK